MTNTMESEKKIIKIRFQPSSETIREIQYGGSIDNWEDLIKRLRANGYIYFEAEAVEEYGDMEVRFIGKRPETDSEMLARLQDEAHAKVMEEQRERRLLDQLRKKYPE